MIGFRHYIVVRNRLAFRSAAWLTVPIEVRNEGTKVRT